MTVRFSHVSPIAGGLWLSGMLFIPTMALTLFETQNLDLTIVERYGVFGLLCVVILGVGVFSGTLLLKSLNKLGDNVQHHRQAVEKMAEAITDLVHENKDARREATVQRDDAVRDLKRHIDDAITADRKKRS